MFKVWNENASHKCMFLLQPLSVSKELLPFFILLFSHPIVSYILIVQKSLSPKAGFKIICKNDSYFFIIRNQFPRKIFVFRTPFAIHLMNVHWIPLKITHIAQFTEHPHNILVLPYFIHSKSPKELQTNPQLAVHSHISNFNISLILSNYYDYINILNIFSILSQTLFQYSPFSSQHNIISNEFLQIRIIQYRNFSTFSFKIILILFICFFFFVFRF